MRPLVYDNEERTALDHLAAEMRACSPRQPAPSADMARQMIEIPWRSRQRSLRRQWLGVAIAAGAVGIFVGAALRHAPGGLWRSPARPIEPPQLERGLDKWVRLENFSQQATVADLGLDIGRLLLRPGSQVEYDAEARTARVRAGTAIFHILPRGRGFRVKTAKTVIEVTGTLFSVNARSGATHVWHGTVVQWSRSPRRTRRVIRGSTTYPDLPARDLRWLGFSRSAMDETTDTATHAAAATPATVSSPVRSGTQKVHSSHRNRRRRRQRPARAKHDAERQLLLRAENDLVAGRPNAALKLLQTHRLRYPKSSLLEESMLLTIRALHAIKDYRRLSEQAGAFLRQFPRSAKAPEIARLQRQAQVRMTENHPE